MHYTTFICGEQKSKFYRKCAILRFAKHKRGEIKRVKTSSNLRKTKNRSRNMLLKMRSALI